MCIVYAMKNEPVYGLFQRKIRQAILQQQYRPGEFIGTEIEFVRTEGLSRTSVRRAVSDLIAEGLIERRPGKGLYAARMTLLIH